MLRKKAINLLFQQIDRKIDGGQCNIAVNQEANMAIRNTFYSV